ncbi:MAG: aldo/keto reductase [Anaerolineae bacterium]|nr:aldo/keto reductase [Anaerolineae bacterium]
MSFTTIPQTDLNPYTICFGTSNLGATIDTKTSFAMLDAYADAGGNMIDTAIVYSNWIPGTNSTSEKTLGQWIKARGNRERMIVATKGGHPYLDTMHIPRLSPQEIVEDLHASLEHLQTDYIDLYYLHRDDPTRPVQEIVDTLNQQIRTGQVRYIACSNWRAERIRAANDYARAHGLHGFVANQMLWNLAPVDPDKIADKTMAAMTDDLYTYHRQTGLAAIPYSSQANGLFQKLAQAGTLDQTRSGAVRMVDLDETRRRLERIQHVQSQTALSITQIVLAYLISQPFPTIPVVGCRTPEQLADSLQAADVRLTPVQIAYLEHGH